MLKLVKRNFSNFHRDFEANKVEITTFQKMVLAFGSSVICLRNPRRADLIACLGEVTGNGSAKFMLNQMQKSREGRQVLTERPRINSQTVDLSALKAYPDGTLGRAYSDFLEKNVSFGHILKSQLQRVFSRALESESQSRLRGVRT